MGFITRFIWSIARDKCALGAAITSAAMVYSLVVLGASPWLVGGVSVVLLMLAQPSCAKREEEAGVDLGHLVAKEGDITVDLGFGPPTSEDHGLGFLDEEEFEFEYVYDTRIQVMEIAGGTYMDGHWARVADVNRYLEACEHAWKEVAKVWTAELANSAKLYEGALDEARVKLSDLLSERVGES